MTTEDKARERAKRESSEAERRKRRHQEDKLDEALEETFPGSDPVSISQPPKSPADKDAD